MKKLALVLTALCGLSIGAQALEVIPASGGTSIFADTAANSPAAAWTTLGPISLVEKKNGGNRRHFVPGSNLTLVLRAPTGFEFNTSLTPSVTFTGGRDITSASVAITNSTSLVVTYTVTGDTKQDTLVIGATSLQVRPTLSAPLASGHIHRPAGAAGGTAVIKGVNGTVNLNGTGTGVTSFGQLIEVTGVPTKLSVLVQPSANAIVDTPFGRQPKIAVTDNGGNTKTNVNGLEITATLESGAGNLLGTKTANTVNGVATFVDLAADEPSTITITFSAADLDSVTSDQINVAPVPEPSVATYVDIQTQPSLVTSAGALFAQQPVVVVRDQYDVLFTDTEDFEITAERLSGSGTLQGTTTVEVVNGVAVFTDLFHTVAGEMTIQFSGGDLTAAVSHEITIEPTAIVRLGFETEPGSAASGTPFDVQPVVVTQDEFGNFSLEGLPLSLTLTIELLVGEGTLSGTTTLDIGSDEDFGVGNFTDLEIDLPGEKQLVAKASGYINATSAVFTVTSDSQTIDFGPLDDKTFGDAPFEVSATASSGLDVEFSIFSGPATISDNIVTITGAGTVTVRASQPGDEVYDAAPDVDQSFEVNKADQTITFAVIGDKTVGEEFGLAATASSGLTVTFAHVSGPATVSGTNVTITGAGLITVRASQGGDGNYNAAPNVDRSFTAHKIDQTITFAVIGDKTVGEEFGLEATASSGLTVTFAHVSGPATVSGTNVTITGAGLITVRASQGGDGNYNAAPNVDRSFTAHKIDQTITFGVIGDKTVGEEFGLAATASSGLTVTFAHVSGPATVSGTNVTITGAGLITVRASQGGNDTYNAAPNVDRSFTAHKIDQTITFGAIGDKSIGEEFGIEATASSGLPVSFVYVSGPATLSGTNVTITGAGTVILRASQGGDDTYNAAPNVDRTFTVNKLGQTITFGSLDDKFVGAPSFDVAATASSGLTVSFDVSGPATISGNTITLTGVGLVTVVASQAGNGDYNAAPDVEQSFNVSKIAKTDINGDQKTDILFQDERIIGIWYMDGTDFIGTDTIRNAGPGTANWRVFGQADFTGDNSLDIAFQHFDGRLAIWEMQGNQKISAQFIRNGQPSGPGWRAVSVADMDGDNHTDIVFQNTDGRVAIWYMDRLDLVSSVLVRGTEALGWRVRGAGDVDGDLVADILVQHTDGRIAIWKGGNFSTTINLNNGNPVGWRIVGLGDFNGDDQVDLLFRSVDNRLAVWLMDGVNRSSAVILRDGKTVDPRWKVVGPR